MNAQRVVVCTRLHAGRGVELEPAAADAGVEDGVRAFALAALAAGAAAVVVAVDAERPALAASARAAAASVGPHAHVLPVCPWGAYSPALNALLADAARRGFAGIVYASLEVRFNAAVLAALVAHWACGSTLVVGAAFGGHHDTEPPPPPPAVEDERAGAPRELRRPLTGSTSPWNTLALWDVQRLLRTGFLALSDGLVAGVPGGIEEPLVIALQQQLDAAGSAAKLLVFPTDHHEGGGGRGRGAGEAQQGAAPAPATAAPYFLLQWRRGEAWDAARRAAHALRMASKNERAELQRCALQLPRGAVVDHVYVERPFFILYM
jgi:hypothetical protein